MFLGWSSLDPKASSILLGARVVGGPPVPIHLGERPPESPASARSSGPMNADPRLRVVEPIRHPMRADRLPVGRVRPGARLLGISGAAVRQRCRSASGENENDITSREAGAHSIPRFQALAGSAPDRRSASRSHSGRPAGHAVPAPPYASSDSTTFPCTSVSRKCRPWCRNVSRL